MGIENLAEDMLNEDFGGKKEEQKSESAGAGRVEDAVIEGMRMIDDEIQRLQERVAEGKKSELQNLAEFSEELSVAKKERNEWGKLLKSARYFWIRAILLDSSKVMVDKLRGICYTVSMLDTLAGFFVIWCSAGLAVKVFEKE
ncbi:MAG: hypothetical protein Q7R85_04365 [bacterium]|nr:hypothetical protein [bacterium]